MADIEELLDQPMKTQVDRSRSPGLRKGTFATSIGHWHSRVPSVSHFKDPLGAEVGSPWRRADLPPNHKFHSSRVA